MVLTPGSSDSDTTVFVRTEGKSYPLGTLSRDRTFRKLDLYFNSSSNTSFYATGPGEVNLIGYFEPEGDSSQGSVQVPSTTNATEAPKQQGNQSS